MSDPIIIALKTVQRKPKLQELFFKVLADAQVFTMVRPGSQACRIRGEVDGRTQDYLACFSNPVIANRSLRVFSGFSENEGMQAQIKPIQVLKLFFAAARGGLAIYLNPKNRPEERYFFTVRAVKEFLAGPWALNLDQVPETGTPGRKPRRSRPARATAGAESALIPISEVDFDRPLTAGQLAEIFGLTEGAVLRCLTDFERDGVLDLESVSISLDAPDPAARSLKSTRYFDPLVAFHIGYQLPGARGNEFRQWHLRLLHEYLGGRTALENQNADLQSRLEAAEQARQRLETEAREKDRTIEHLTAVPAGLDEAIGRLRQELSLKNKRIAELTGDLQAAGGWDCPESVMDARYMAEARYGSKLIFHERVDRTIEEFSLNNDLRATVEAVKMFKALAECLHPLKFEGAGFSEERFRDETGLALSMTESRASKREKAIEESRVCWYQGVKVLFYPHLKKNIQGIQMRLHFQFIEDERKILICHLGDHLPNAKTRHLQ